MAWLSLSSEIAHAIVAGTVEGWTGTRWVDTGGGHVFKHWFCGDSSYKERQQCKLLQEFADSVRGMHIVRHSPAGFHNNGDEFSEARRVRYVDFAIGSDTCESVIIRVAIQFNPGSMIFLIPKKMTNHWSDWEPATHNTVTCIRHSDKRFEGKIILGRAMGKSAFS